MSDGFASLAAEDIGKEMSFQDINRARGLGLCGPEPIPVWGSEDWNLFLSNICAGVNFTEGG